MAPIVNGLQNDFTERATVMQLDANEADNAQLQHEYGLRGHPTFVVLDENGRAVQTFVGPQTKETLHEALTAVTASVN